MDADSALKHVVRRAGNLGDIACLSDWSIANADRLDLNDGDGVGDSSRSLYNFDTRTSADDRS